jgi:uncharacterized membrane protein (TIGR02234 family)
MLVVAAAALWGSSRLTWVDVTSFDGLGQPKTVSLSGGTWATALVPLALLLLAAAVAVLAVRGTPLRLLEVLVAVSSAGMAYPAITLWAVRDVNVPAAHLADVPMADLVGTTRHNTGAVITVAAALLTLAAAVLLMRSATKESSGLTRYTRRAPAEPGKPTEAASDRMLWDALDAGRDPTDPDNKGR